MSDQQSDHPGPEWVECFYPRPSTDGSKGGYFHHYGLNMSVYWAEPANVMLCRTEAIASCRQISAAALAWESMKAQLLCPNGRSNKPCQAFLRDILQGESDIAAWRTISGDDLREELLKGTSGEAADTTSTITGELKGEVK